MKQINIQKYKTLVFDCDGVVLNSNKVKTKAFYHSALPYGDAAAQLLVGYHIKNGGVSRYKKFEYFVEEILQKEIAQEELNALLSVFATEVKNGLMTCGLAEGIFELRNKAKEARWLIVSGGDENELREVFASREIDTLFDGGIFGSPDDKGVILEREIKNCNVQGPALFLGDSKYDYQVASNFGLDFIFLSEWSEVVKWDEWISDNKIISYKNISSVLQDSVLLN